VALTVLTAVLSRLSGAPVMISTVVSAFSEAISPVAHVSATFTAVSGWASVAASVATSVAAAAATATTTLWAVDPDVTLFVAVEAETFFELAGAAVMA